MSDDKETAAPYTEDLSKQALVDHLRDVHGMNNISGTALPVDARKARVTKERLVTVHSSMHRTLDKPTAEVNVQGGRVYDGTTHYGVPLPSIAHVHAEVTVKAEVQEALESIRSGANPLEGSRLSAGERSALIRLIDNDYGALKTDLQGLAAQALANDLAQLELDWRERRAKISTWQAAVQVVRDDVRRRMEEIKQDADRDGILMEWNRTGSEILQVVMTAAGYEKAVRETKETNKKMLDSALLKLERERLRAQRRVLLTGITPEAQKILETIPSAEKMLGEVMAREAGTRQLETPVTT